MNTAAPMKNLHIVIFLAAAWLGGVLPAAAGEFNGSFTAETRIPGACTASATELNFQTYTRTEGNEAESLITVRCNQNATVTIALDGGLAGSVAERRLRLTTDSAQVLSYNLYRDENHTQVWGNTAGTNTMSASVTGPQTDVPVPVYGRIVENQTVPEGRYMDTINVSVTL